MEIKELSEIILSFYEKELLKKRRPEQVSALMGKPQNQGYAEKCAGNLLRWKLEYRVEDFIAAQFFALSYMPYLPNLMHIASENSFERWNKVKSFYKEVRGKKVKKKVFKKISKSHRTNDQYYNDILDIRKFEELDKKRFYNKLQGFQLCLEMTSLYHPESELCENCKFKNYCISVLNKENPSLLKMRLKQIKNETYINNMRKYEKEISLRA